MKYIFLIISILFCSCTFLKEVETAWSGFDLVRPWGGWGSNDTTSFIRITSKTANAPNISATANFGWSVANVGDINGDFYDDIAVGAIGESVDYGDGPKLNAGAVYILFMGPKGIIMSYVRICGEVNGGPKLSSGDQFGYSIAAMGDIDNDTVPDIAVGAPGYIVSSVYILFLHRNGSVKSTRLIRGRYIGDIPSTFNDSFNLNASSVSIKQDSYVINGPSIPYASRFGAAICNLGDLNHDGFTDLAITSIGSSSGVGVVYILYLDNHGVMLSYSSFRPGDPGLPSLPPFSGFAYAIQLVPDMDNNSVPELAIGAPFLDEAGSPNFQSGNIFIAFLLSNGSVNYTSQITENYLNRNNRGWKTVMHSKPYDNCGSSLAFIGDINRDEFRQHYPDKLSNDPGRVSIPDLISGCPQPKSSGEPGRIMILFLNKVGLLQTSVPIPYDQNARQKEATKNLGLNPFDQFGKSISGYQDIDKNGLKEIIVGAPGDSRDGKNAGAVYIIFIRRRRFHPIPFDWWTFYTIVTVVPFIYCCLICSGTIFFFWYFRRIPDPVEVIVKDSGLHIDTRTRPKFDHKNKIYCEEYTL